MVIAFPRTNGNGAYTSVDEGASKCIRFEPAAWGQLDSAKYSYLIAFLLVIQRPT